MSSPKRNIRARRTQFTREEMEVELAPSVSRRRTCVGQCWMSMLSALRIDFCGSLSPSSLPKLGNLKELEQEKSTPNTQEVFAYELQLRKQQQNRSDVRPYQISRITRGNYRALQTHRDRVTQRCEAHVRTNKGHHGDEGGIIGESSAGVECYESSRNAIKNAND